jgi:hypothetical protein
VRGLARLRAPASIDPLAWAQGGGARPWPIAARARHPNASRAVARLVRGDRRMVVLLRN